MKRPQCQDPLVNKYIDQLEDQLERIRGSAELSSYKTLTDQIESWNSQLKLGKAINRIIGTNEDGTPITVTTQAGFIDLFSDKDNKEFDRAFKYFQELDGLLEKRKKIWSMMTEEEKSQVQKKGGLAERLAGNGNP